MDTIYKFYRNDFQDLHEFYDEPLLTPKSSLIQVIHEEIY
jgi:hypothetical protein